MSKNIETNRYKLSQTTKELIIMRGISGSGKSTLAKQIAGEKGVICSADDYFVEKGKGEYSFNPRELPMAHKACQDKALNAIKMGKTPVIIDNTNVTLWEMKQLKNIIGYAQNQGYSIRIEEPKTEWFLNRNAEELAKKNQHGVPKEIIEKKIRQWEPNVTVDDIMTDGR